MNITLDRIIALIVKLEEEHPEVGNMLRIMFYDDLSGCFEYDVYSRGHEVEILCQFGGVHDKNNLDSLMKKYGV